MKTVDHIIPISWGGSNSVDNLVASCKWCNEQKADKTLLDFWNHIESLKKLGRVNGGYAFYVDLEVIQRNINKLQKRLFENAPPKPKSEEILKEIPK